MLGTGGFASVWRARDTRSRALVALKVLHPTYCKPPQRRGPSVADRFVREARLLQEAAHPGLVRILDVVEIREERVIAYAMELLTGLELGNLLERCDALPLSILLEIFARVGDTLAYMHERGVIHRDVKLPNIFLCDPEDALSVDRQVKLLDLGIAKELNTDLKSADTATGVFVGTLGATAPECFARLAGHTQELTGAVDQWGLGVALYQALTGTIPFRHHVPALQVAKIQTEPAPSIILRDGLDAVACPPEVESLVQRCLRKSPRDRYASMEEVSRALRQIARAALSDPEAIEQQLHALPTSVPLEELGTPQTDLGPAFDSEPVFRSDVSDAVDDVTVLNPDQWAPNTTIDHDPPGFVSKVGLAATTLKAQSPLPKPSVSEEFLDETVASLSDEPSESRSADHSDPQAYILDSFAAGFVPSADKPTQYLEPEASQTPEPTPTPELSIDPRNAQGGHSWSIERGPSRARPADAVVPGFYPREAFRDASVPEPPVRQPTQTSSNSVPSVPLPWVIAILSVGLVLAFLAGKFWG